VTPLVLRRYAFRVKPNVQCGDVRNESVTKPQRIADVPQLHVLRDLMWLTWHEMPRPQADDDIRELVASRLRAALELRGKTQQDASYDLRVSLSQINRNLRGKHTPSVDTVVRFCRYLDVSADWVLGLSDEPRPAPTRARTAEDIVEMADALLEAEPLPPVSRSRRRS